MPASPSRGFSSITRMPLALARGELGVDVVGLEAEVVDAFAPLGQELADAALVGERLQQLDLALADLEERRRHVLIEDGLHDLDGKPEHVAPEAVRLLEVADDDPDVMDLR